MDFLVPYDNRDPKTRLGPLLDRSERQDLAGAMLLDVLAAFDASEHDPHLLSTAPIDVGDLTRCSSSDTIDREAEENRRDERIVPMTIDERPLTEAVNAAIEAASGPIGILMADLPLVTGETIDELVATEGDVVVAPGLGGGTNALVIRQPGFRVDYHGVSVRDHFDRAAAIGASAIEFDSRRLATDVDEPVDLVEVLLHSDGAAAEWLAEQGFRIEVEAERDRVTAVRD